MRTKLCLTMGRWLTVFALATARLLHAQRDAQADRPVYYMVTITVTLNTPPPPATHGTMSLSMFDETGFSVGTGGGAGPDQTVTLATMTAKLYPGKNYALSASVSADSTATLRFTTVQMGVGESMGVAGFVINGTKQDQVVHLAGASGNNYVDTVGISQDEVIGDTGLRGGEASGIAENKPIWYVGLGRMRNGAPAGAVGFRRSDLSAPVFTPGALYYDSPDLSEVDVIHPGGVIQQIAAREVFLDVQTQTSTSYTISAYARSQATGPLGGPYTLTGQPFVVYTVAQAVLPEGTGLKITRVEDAVTWETSLVLAGTAWTARSWRVPGAADAPAISKIVSNYPASGPTTVTHWGRNAANTADEFPLAWTKTFATYPWGKEVDKQTFGTVAPLVETQYSYYTTTASDGSVERKLKHVISPSGGWTKYLYYDTTTPSGQRGWIKRVYRPWLDLPASPDSALSTNSVYEDRTYAAAFDGGATLPAEFITRAPNGQTLARTTWQHFHNVGTLGGHIYAQENRRDWSGSGANDYLETLTRYYRSDVASRYLRGKPVSVVYPDGRKESYAYLDGTWNDTARSFTFDGTGPARAILRFHGQTTGGTTVDSWGVWIDSVQMVANKSLVSETIIDTNGRVVQTRTYVFLGQVSAGVISGTYYKYDEHNRPIEEIDLTRGVGTAEYKTSRVYSSSLITSATAADGVVTSFGYDSLLRVIEQTTGATGVTGYPQRKLQFKYDGANRQVESYTVKPAPNPATVRASLVVFDPAGRVLSQSAASPNTTNSGLLDTDFIYDSKTQTTTVLPTGATRIEEIHLDGRPKSVSGTAAVPVAYTYAANATGLATTVTQNGALNWGFSETTTDWLGRLAKQSTPAFGYDSGGAPNNILDRWFDYYTVAAGSNPVLSGLGGIGSLYRERTTYRATSTASIAATIHTYDVGARPLWTGLDLDGSGTLVAASADRIQAVDSSYAQDTWGWQNIAVTTTYPNAYPGSDAGTAKEISRVKTRLTGFGQNALEVDTSNAVVDLRGTYLVVGEVETIDTAGRAMQQRQMVDRTLRKQRTRDTVAGVTTAAYALSNNGYSALSLSSSGVRTTSEYDDLGRVAAVKGRYNGTTPAETTSYTYYLNTPHVQVATTSGTPSAITASYAYQWGTADGLAAGAYRVAVTDAAGNISYTLSQAGDDDPGDGDTQVSGFTRTWGGAAQPVQTVADKLGRTKRQTTWRDAVGDTWPTGTGATTTWNYHSATGLMWYKTMADGMSTVYNYDELARTSYRSWVRRRLNSGLPPSNSESAVITRWVYSPGSGDLTNTNYNDDSELAPAQPTTDLSYTYTRGGQLASVTDATGTRAFAYNASLLLATETLGSVFYGTNRVLAPTYDAAVPGRATGLQFKNNGTVEFEPNFTFDPAAGRLATASGIGATLNFTTYTVGTDWIQSVTSGANYVRNQTLLTNRSVLSKVETKWGATNLATYDSTVANAFDTRGQRVIVNQSGSIPTTGNLGAAYNARCELTGVTFSAAATKNATWDYDTMGKRKTTVQNSATTTYNPTAASADINTYATITGPNAETGLAYDLDGNTTVDGTWNYTYDAENRIVRMAAKDLTQYLYFTYDYLGRRVQKTVRNSSFNVISSTKYVYSGWQLLAELDAGTGMTGSTLSKSYLWGPDFSNGQGGAGGAGGLLAVKQSGTTYFPAYDHAGNVTGYINATTGAVAAKWDYNAFGEILASSGATSSFTFGFATQQTDRQSNLVYYGLRFYQPKHGRFINRDPIEEAGGNNLYAFCGNSPGNRWDVLGLSFQLMGTDDGFGNIPFIGDPDPSWTLAGGGWMDAEGRTYVGWRPAERTISGGFQDSWDDDLLGFTDVSGFGLQIWQADMARNDAWYGSIDRQLNEMATYADAVDWTGIEARRLARNEAAAANNVVSEYYGAPDADCAILAVQQVQRAFGRRVDSRETIIKRFGLPVSNFEKGGKGIEVKGVGGIEYLRAALEPHGLIVDQINITSVGEFEELAKSYKAMIVGAYIPEGHMVAVIPQRSGAELIIYNALGDRKNIERTPADAMNLKPQFPYNVNGATRKIWVVHNDD